MSDSPPIRLGIIGCGNVLDAYMPQCEKLRARRLAEVIIACGRESQRERALAFGVPRFTANERDVLPPLTLLPATGISGLAIHHGNAFPPEMRNNLFSAQHNPRKIARHRLTAKRASYAVENFDFVTTDDPDIHFSDVLEDSDGSLLLVDTGSWYAQHCPTGRIRQAPARGGIYRVSVDPSNRRKAAQTLAGGKLGKWEGERDTNAVHSHFPTFSPAHLPTTIPDLRLALRGTNEATIAAAARAAGRRGETNAASELTGLLRSPNPALCLAAAEALACCGNQSSGPALIEALAGDTDDFLEHALSFALYRLGDREALVSALSHPNAKVQRAALLLLDQPPFQAAPAAAVVARLNAGDSRLRDAARWVLLRHAEWGEASAAFLRQLIAEPNPTDADRKALGQFLPLFQTNTTVIAAIA